uniref:C2H2-type domain-containing protein n=1 Tax=Oryza punctata TaxID=4537 RepID=A0A0E0LYC5_ORYPU
MAPSRISSSELERPVGSYRFHIPRQPPRIQAEGGKRHTIIGDRRHGGTALWRRGSMLPPSLPRWGVEDAHGYVDGGSRQHLSELGTSSALSAPIGGWIWRSVAAQAHGEVIDVGRCEDEASDHMQPPTASPSSMEMLSEERISASGSVVRERQLHGYEEQPFLPCLATMTAKGAAREISTKKIIKKEHGEAGDLTAAMLVPSWTSTGNHISKNPTGYLEHLPELSKRAHREAYGNMQLATGDLVAGLHKQAAITVPPPNISEIGGHLTAHKNSEMTVGKGVQNTIDASVAKEVTRSLASSARQSRRGPYACRKCGTMFSSGQALGGHMKSHYSDERPGDERVPSAFVGSFLSLITPMNVSNVSVPGSRNPHASSVPNKEEGRLLVMGATPLNGVPKGSFRLFGENIAEAPKEEPME